MTMKRGGPVRDQVPSRVHCPKSLLGINSGVEDCPAALACEVLFFAKILVYVIAETFSKVRHKLLIDLRVLIQKIQLSPGGAREYHMSPIYECVAQYQYSVLSWRKLH
jgi:hypothetical protein